MLLVSAATNKCSEIKNLDIILLAKSKNKAIFSLKGFTETSKPGKQPPNAIFYSFPGNEVKTQINLCPVKTLEFYLKVSEPWWRKRDRSQLLLSFVKPHKPISSATLARWIKEMLKFSEINTDIFKAHSVRSASTSKAKSLGITTKYILRKGNWSGESTWQKFYNEEIRSKEQIFQESVLQMGTL